MARTRLSLVAAMAALAAIPALAQTPQTGGATPAPRAGTAPATAPAAPVAAAAAAPKAALVDINHATKEELDTLPGIGPVRAEAIIKGRPYKGKDELLRKNVLPSNVYEGIKDRVVARQS